jgi:hypothetical protein
MLPLTHNTRVTTALLLGLVALVAPLGVALAESNSTAGARPARAAAVAAPASHRHGTYIEPIDPPPSDHGYRRNAGDHRTVDRPRGLEGRGTGIGLALGVRCTQRSQRVRRTGHERRLFDRFVRDFGLLLTNKRNPRRASDEWRGVRATLSERRGRDRRPSSGRSVRCDREDVEWRHRTGDHHEQRLRDLRSPDGTAARIDQLAIGRAATHCLYERATRRGHRQVCGAAGCAVAGESGTRAGSDHAIRAAYGLCLIIARLPNGLPACRYRCPKRLALGGVVGDQRVGDQL